MKYHNYVNPFMKDNNINDKAADDIAAVLAVNAKP